jgi:hypothetical protein
MLAAYLLRIRRSAIPDMHGSPRDRANRDRASDGQGVEGTAFPQSPWCVITTRASRGVNQNRR